MTHKENITAILECYFTGFKDEIIESACNRILEQEHLYIDKPRGYQAHSISDEETCDYYDPKIKTCSRSEIPFKIGHWRKNENKYWWWYECDQCGSEPLKNDWQYELSPYCLNCGAKMEGEE